MIHQWSTPRRNAASTLRTHNAGQRLLRALTVAGLVTVGTLNPFTAGAVTPIHAAIQARTISPQAALERLMTASDYPASWFAPAFLAQVSPTQLAQGRATIVATLGAYQGIRSLGEGSFLLLFSKGTIQARIHLDTRGRIDGLLFGAPQLTHLTRAAVLQQLRTLPGRVSVLVLTNGIATTASNDRQPLAVGSAFKLAVLLALRQRITAGKLSWSQKVMLHAGDRVYSSAALQKQPDGARLTVAQLATYMISVSDNTAADLLIRLVGRAAIDPLIPAQDRPLLTTHDLFALKDPAHGALRAQYLHATPAQRLPILEQADRLPLPPLSALAGLLARGPVAPEVEYFFSTRQLCALMQQVRDLPAMQVNPGVADPKSWQSVAYKGGSETGVLNLTTLVRSHGGTTYCVSATWNNSAVLNETRFETLYASLLQALPH